MDATGWWDGVRMQIPVASKIPLDCVAPTWCKTDDDNQQCCFTLSTILNTNYDEWAGEPAAVASCRELTNSPSCLCGEVAYE